MSLIDLDDRIKLRCGFYGNKFPVCYLRGPVPHLPHFLLTLRLNVSSAFAPPHYHLAVFPVTRSVDQ